jgi:hypothetical protein
MKVGKVGSEHEGVVSMKAQEGEPRERGLMYHGIKTRKKRG